MRPVLLALLALAVAAPGAAAAPVCGPPAAETIAAGALTRVFVGPNGDSYRACTRGVRRQPTIGRGCRTGRGCGSGIEVLAVAGRLVATAYHAADANYAELIVVDVATGHLAAPEDPRLGYDPLEVQRIGKLVVRADGSTAVAVEHAPLDPSRPPAGVEIRRSAGCGAQRLDDGPDVDPGSVRLTRDGWVTWVRGGVLRRARACPTTQIARRACPLAAQRDLIAVSRSAVGFYTPDEDGRVRACAGRRGVLGDAFGVNEILLDAAAGDGWVAYWTESCKDGCVEFLSVLDPRSGRTEFTHRLEALDPASLRIAGGRVHWSEGGRRRSKALPRPGQRW